MSCAACSARVEKAVSSVDGVASCSVSLLTNSMGVEGTASPEEIIKAVTDAGYGATVKDENSGKESSLDELKDTETPKLIKRLILSLVLLIPLMYISMGHMMWGWPLPSFMTDNHIAMGLSQMILALAVIIINKSFFVNGFKGIIHKSPNMDTLVALGSGASFIYSCFTLISMLQTSGDTAKSSELMNGFYFESAAMILALITVGKTLEAYSKGKTTDALKGLISLTPKTAVILKDGAEMTVPVSQVIKDDIFIVRPGESVPVDGIITEGFSSIDESALTGESIPVDKSEGEKVFAATINKSGYLKCKATGVGEDTALSQIIKMVSDAAATKAPIAKIADRVSGVFVPIVIGIGLISFLIWLIVGKEFGYALSRGISVLVISCPCSLGLATPVAVMVGNGKGAKNGILFKTASALEETGKIQIVALDKTGTITNGKPVVTDIIPSPESSPEELVLTACSLEKKSDHPLARSISDYGIEKNIEIIDTQGFEELSGKGISAVLKGKKIRGGSLKFISEICSIEDSVKDKAEQLSKAGKTMVFFADEDKFLGVIALADTIKSDSPKAIEELHNMGIKVVMITGDNEKTARSIGEQAGVDDVIAEVMPNEKEAVIRLLMEKGKTAMVGDGINDAPALTRADIGIAIASGTDIAADAADIVLMNSRLTDVAAAIRLSRRTLINIKENLFWAFIYNIIGIPLAAGMWIPITGWALKPMYGAAAMSLSSFCVVSNALRLNLLNIYSSDHDKAKISVELPDLNIIKEEKTMTKTIKVEGMMCPHCEAHVKQALEAVEGITEAVASHTEGTVTLTLSKEVDEGIIGDTVVKAGYKFIG